MMPLRCPADKTGEPCLTALGQYGVCVSELYIKILYVELVGELGQDELVPFSVRRCCQHVWKGCTHRGRLLLCHTIELLGKSNVTRQLKAFILRTKRTHGLIRPHCPRSWIREQ